MYWAVIAVIGLVAVVNSKQHESNELKLERELAEKDRMLTTYRAFERKVYNDFDSLQMRIDEKDTIVYRAGADSIERKWAKRFGRTAE